MIVYNLPTAAAWWHESKAGSARLSHSQFVHRQVSQSCGLPVVVGGVEEAGAYLISQGILKQVDGVWEYIGS